MPRIIQKLRPTRITNTMETKSSLPIRPISAKFYRKLMLFYTLNKSSFFD